MVGRLNKTNKKGKQIGRKKTASLSAIPNPIPLLGLDKLDPDQTFFSFAKSEFFLHLRNPKMDAFLFAFRFTKIEMQKK